MCMHQNGILPSLSWLQMRENFLVEAALYAHQLTKLWGELISPAAKIAACHAGIGVKLMRLTLSFGFWVVRAVRGCEREGTLNRLMLIICSLKSKPMFGRGEERQTSIVKSFSVMMTYDLHQIRSGWAQRRAGRRRY